jgi:hypothetical protein
VGHIRLGDLPQTRPWKRVIEMLGADPTAPDVAAATLVASHKALHDAGRDPTLVRSFWLLTQLPLCARTSDFPRELETRGLTVSANPSLLELTGAFSEAIDAHARKGGMKTDLSEMAQMAAAEALVSSVSREVPRLFGTDAKDVQNALARFSTRKGFAALARAYFSRLTERFLLYHLSRELSNHVGANRSFADVNEHLEFRKALTLHCEETSVIVEQYASDWYSKTNFEERPTGITEKHVSKFLGYAFRKVRAELGKRGQGGGPRSGRPLRRG